MLRNYLKLTWRNLNRNKVSSAINISGLTIALATVSFQSVKAGLANPVKSLRTE